MARLDYERCVSDCVKGDFRVALIGGKMDRIPCRKCTVADLVIIIAATAPAFAVLRTLWPYAPDLYEAYFTFRQSINNLLTQCNYAILATSIVALSLTIASFVLWFRQPRPTIRYLTRRPGMVACTAAVIVLVIRLINAGTVAGILLHDGRLDAWEIYVAELSVIPSEMGCGVAGAWAVQLLSGRWRCERNWLDRAGRVLGFFWIATIPLSPFVYSLA
jgi:hypothetical protein